MSSQVVFQIRIKRQLMRAGGFFVVARHQDRQLAEQTDRRDSSDGVELCYSGSGSLMFRRNEDIVQRSTCYWSFWQAFRLSS
jgi:hypothetical protein